MSEPDDNLTAALFSELFMADQLAKFQIGKVLPKGMELSHFLVLNFLSRSGGERTPGQLAKTFQVTRGAMTNTLSKLERAGHIHVRPDWDDARRKYVTISPAGREACQSAMRSISPILNEVVSAIGVEKARGALPVLRAIRTQLGRVPKSVG